MRLRRHFSTTPHAPPCSRRGHRSGPARRSAPALTPRYFFLSAVRLLPRRTRPPAPAKESTGHRPHGLRPRLRRRRAEPAPELGSRKQQRPPLSSRCRAGPLLRPSASGRGGARAGSRSLRAGAPRGGWRGRASGAPRARLRLRTSPPAQVTEPASSPLRADRARSPSPEAGVFNKPRSSHPSHCGQL